MSGKIAFLGKYFPLEGGNASRTYWLARGLARRGYEVHIIADRPDAGREYACQGESKPAEKLSNLFVHRPSCEIPWHIPESDEQSLALLDLTLDVIKKHNIEVLDTSYLAPYGMVGHTARCITGVKHVVRHGLADVEDFFKKGVFSSLLQGTVKSADAVITDARYSGVFKPLNNNTHVQLPYVVDTESFAIPYSGKDRKHLAYVGKINYYWERKSLRYISDHMHNLVDRYDCTCVCQGIGLPEIQKSLGKNTISEYAWPGFMAPWEMPRFLSKVDALFFFEKPAPHSPVSNLAMEALCAGVGIITNDADFSKHYEGLISINDNQVLRIDPTELFATSSAITSWITKKWVRKPAAQKVSFADYVAENEKIYANLEAMRRSNPDLPNISSCY